jgi:hypothetical protein
MTFSAQDSRGIDFSVFYGFHMCVAPRTVRRQQWQRVSQALALESDFMAPGSMNSVS